MPTRGALAPDSEHPLQLTKGARQLLQLLESYARRSGRAFPFQRTLSDKLGISQQMIRRYLLELKTAGAVTVKKRQHSSAEYILHGSEKPVEIQQVRLRSGLRSELRSGAVYKGMSTDSELRVSEPTTPPLPRKSPQSETNPSYGAEFSRHLTRCELSESAPGYLPITQAAAASGRAPSEAAAVFDRLIQEPRFKGKPLGYVLSAFRRELVG